MRKRFSKEEVLGFTEVRRRFSDYGVYSRAIEGSREFYEFWDREISRSIYGMRVGDRYISGYNYFYLNYCPIYLVREKEIEVGGIKRKVIDREMSFPDFWDGDYESFSYIDRCERNGKHAVELKTRGRGYSYKGASMLVRNYTLIAGSKNYVYAYG